MANLPPDIMVDILTSLPVKSLCRFRCVCKRWHTLISSSNFIKIHLSRSNSSYKRLVFASDSLYSVNYKDSSADGSLIATKLTIPVRSCYKLYEILGSCNGLLLIVNDTEIFLINPITREVENIPNSPFGFNLGADIYGFGFDFSIDDFKVMRISYSVDKDVVSEYIVSVYTLSTGYWRRVKNSPYEHCCSFPSPAVLVNGALHRFAVKTTTDADAFGVISCFDIVEEAFRDILPPNRIECFEVMHYDLGVLGECLCMILDHCTEQFDLWVMKEYGTRDSWNKFTIILSCACATLKPLCFLENGEVLLDVTESAFDGNYYVNNRKFIIHDTKEETYRDVVINGIQCYGGSGTYVESLVSPNHNNRV